ncbi:GLPGLI family protein [Allomuricauda sp.]|uniref:GLPGLI family protein n=1 Tax=Flagellimonas sp. TaxID=2058762 RepID=UPI001B1EEBD8|nr:GLPGLI family protein [Allomuricauda sp.]MBO6532190.1 GLPGLI family protein [Allomuricauda sp.]MBO6587845.1 GLPGLI family protein [Allomuricauda sp.]MBO6617470.1 GLPGLI family protein [Allomuricauda sp.]MBO6643519.1 GLPGLI family protein [Allomuricauda sp.]MBO6745805.1 GLPGLI family protein [Allomuricauda sp.]
MIKRFLLSVFLMSYVFGLSQNSTNGLLIYNVDMDEYVKRMESDTESRPSDDMMRNTARRIKKFKAQLEFDGFRAIFKVPQALSIDVNNKFDNMVRLFVSNGTYYTDLEKNHQIWATKFDGKEINVLKESKDKEWVLQNEKKKIGDFICHKAVFLRVVNGKEQEIVAWYAPEIPVQLGPKDYFGQLPGLILELKEPFLTYRCSRITFDKNKIDPWPVFENTITEKQYQDLTKKTWESILQNR